MNAATLVISVPGPAGSIDVAIDRPVGPPRGLALIAHPHPLFGGTRDNKVVQTLARAFVALGHETWRPNFRGVGASDGIHDEGRGETDDLQTVVAAMRERRDALGLAPIEPAAPLVLAGFSFGCFVTSRLAARLAAAGAATPRLVLVGPAASRFALEAVPADTLVIHGELDDVVPLQAVLDWARPLGLPVTVVPGADHFFHRRLPILKRLVLAAWGVRDGAAAATPEAGD